MRIYIDARSPYAFEKIFGMTLLERILRQLFELGITRNVTVILEPNMPLDGFMRKDFWPRYQIQFEQIHSEAPLLRLVETTNGTDQSLMILEGDGIYDERILRRLLMSTNSLYIHAGEDKDVPIAVIVQADDHKHLNSAICHIGEFLKKQVGNGWLETLSIYDMDQYIPELRQTAVPSLIKLQNKSSIRAIENEMYEKTFKGVIDFIAAYVYRIPVRGLVRLVAPTRITPNLVTAMSVICSLAAIPLFAMGWLGTGLAVAFVFVIADSLDGKLARMTVRFSKVADKVDHFTSPTFETCYYLAWGWYFSRGDFSTLPGKAAVLLCCFFVLDRIVTSVFGCKLGRSLLDYNTCDARFHLIAARRNINLFIMTIGLVLQKPIAALYAITLWMFTTMLWHIYRFSVHSIRKAIVPI
jgi:phosphatidylglycerophosphate synthase